MAVDTPTKRSSALNVRTRCRRFLPVPDGTIAVADRAHLAGVYYEVAAAVTMQDGAFANPICRVSAASAISRVAVAGEFSRVVYARAQGK